MLPRCRETRMTVGERDARQRRTLYYWMVGKYALVALALVAARIGLVFVPSPALKAPRHYEVLLMTNGTTTVLMFPGGGGRIPYGSRILEVFKVAERSVVRKWPSWEWLPVSALWGHQRVVESVPLRWKDQDVELTRDSNGDLTVKLPGMEITPVEFWGWEEYRFAYRSIGANGSKAVRVPLRAYYEALWGTTVIAGIGLLLCDGWRMWRRRLRAREVRQGRCPRCHYERGTILPCPECGEGGSDAGN